MEKQELKSGEEVVNEIWGIIEFIWSSQLHMAGIAASKRRGRTAIRKKEKRESKQETGLVQRCLYLSSRGNKGVGH